YQATSCGASSTCLLNRDTCWSRMRSCEVLDGRNQALVSAASVTCDEATYTQVRAALTSIRDVRQRVDIRTGSTNRGVNNMRGGTSCRCTSVKRHVPQAYRSLLLADLRKAEPEALRHVSQALTKVKLPTERQVPTLIVVGQEEPFV